MKAPQNPHSAGARAKPQRRWVSRLSAFLIALLPAYAAAASAAAKPNLLLILTDDQGYWDLGVTGNPQIQTPNLDRLAKEGVQFKRFYVQPVCSPTRAGLMTGRYYLRTGVYNTRFGGDSMSKSEVTLPELLQRGGYRTGMFGKWHLGHYYGYQPNQRGFSEFLGQFNGHLERYEYSDQLVHNGQPVVTRGYVTDLFTDAAMEFISTAARTPLIPFFCYLAYNAPHEPHLLDTSVNHLAEGDAMIDAYLKRGLPLAEARIYAQVERIDQNVGRLLKHLDAAGLTENTVVAFMSDNGGVSKFFKAGLRGNKASVYEGGVRSPLFVRWPGHFPAGTEVAAQTSHLDLLPTFCELAGVPIPTDRPLDGLSLVPLLQAGRGDHLHDYIYETWNRFFPDPDEKWGISEDRYKLEANFPSKEKVNPKGWALYDLATDPGEEKSVAQEHPEKVKALRAEFERWYREVTAGVTYRPIPIPLGQLEENPVELQASWATVRGASTRYEFSGYDWDTIEGWSQPGDAADWQIDVVRPGRYAIEIAYGLRAEDAGGRLKVSIGDRSLECQPRPTPTANVFERMSLGEMSLPAGRATLRAELVSCPGSELMHLNRLWLKKVP